MRNAQITFAGGLDLGQHSEKMEFSLPEMDLGRNAIPAAKKHEFRMNLRRFIEKH